MIFQVQVTVHVTVGLQGFQGGIFAVTNSWDGTTVSGKLPGPLSPMTTSNITLSIPVGVGAVRLWWPNGVVYAAGAIQTLYKLTITYTPDGIASPTILDSRRIGFRTVALVTDDDTNPSRLAPLVGSGTLTTRYRINGASIWSRGSNVIPLDEYAGRADADALTEQVKSIAAAGMNMILIWGGGIFEYDAFYNAADELGILLYHDLMYSAQTQMAHLCSATDLQRREITANVRRLAAHPSVAVWAAGNEIGGGGVFASFAMMTVVGEDLSRPVWPSSPASGWQTGVDRLWGHPDGSLLSVRLASDPSPDLPPNVQAGTFYMGFEDKNGPSWTDNSTQCGQLCDQTPGCEVAVYGSLPQNRALCTLKGFGFPIAACGFAWSYSVWPQSTPKPLPVPPAPCISETHGPYTGGRGWPAINSGNSTDVEPFDANTPPNLPSPQAMGITAPGLFTSEFGVTSFSSFESISPTLSPKDWGVHAPPMYRIIPCLHHYIFMSYMSQLSFVRSS